MMKRTALFSLFLLASLFSSVYAVDFPAPDKPTANESGAYGVSFTYPSEMTFSKETDDVSTKLGMRLNDRLPWILVQIYDVETTPEEALEVNLRVHRKSFEKDGWAFTESFTQEKIAGSLSQGKQLVFTAKNIEFTQRFFTFVVHKHVVFLTTLCKTPDDLQTRNLLAQVASSFH